MPEDDPTTDPGPPGEGTSTVRADPAQLRPGQHIGHYKILEQIGEGGFAVGRRSRPSSLGSTPGRSASVDGSPEPVVVIAPRIP